MSSAVSLYVFFHICMTLSLGIPTENFRNVGVLDDTRSSKTTHAENTVRHIPKSIKKERFLVTDMCLSAAGTSSSVKRATASASNGRVPLKSDKIAIIGAGPAGIHMAYKLKELGFTHITIFEKTNRIGGKSYTVHHRGIRHEFGTLFVTAEYHEVFKLLHDFGGSVIPADRASNWIDPNNFLMSEYVYNAIAREYGIHNRTLATDFITNAANRYVKLHHDLFSNYDGDLMPRPSPNVLLQIKGTFMDFLTKYNMTVLKLIFLSSQNVQGYGSLDKISAIYGLMWNTPGFLIQMLKTGPDTSILKQGFQSLWKSIASREHLNVILNARIKQIIRDDHITIKYDKHTHSSVSQRCDTFDFLILASNMKSILPHLTNTSPSERHIFHKLKPSFFSLTLVDSNYGRRGSTPTNYFFYNVLSPEEHDVWASLDSYAALQRFSGDNYTRGVYPDNPALEHVQTAMFYQFGDSHPNTTTLNSYLHKHLVSFGMGNYTVVKRKIWSYFPRYNPVDMSNGILWDILDMQGYRKTWYIGSSVTFESVKSVLEYNKLLLRKFNLTTV